MEYFPRRLCASNVKVVKPADDKLSCFKTASELAEINGERFHLRRAFDHEGEVLEYYFTRRQNNASAKKFLMKAMYKHGSPKIITRDKLVSYGATFRRIGVVDRQLYGGWSNNRCENSDLPFRRRE